MQAMSLRKLLRPRPRFSAHIPKQLVASALWDYGEDALAERARTMSEKERLQVETIAAWYEIPEYPLPMAGQRITHNHVAAFSAITLFEGSVRPLARTRRRPAKDRPADLAE
ncbi:hypothetical protein ASE01_18580 [Nocardioides sp. Root190]|uniref:hypothetical protein n=1 Tax=Nocardioides sp. Root190 TaxID=1736488 RepID=UPI000701848E|nr:hypothetical protein [Nocardioides sp. Root190]KRB74002.1 hypothetical protein ASE01_18580 [Nocardioides sp. Root190]